VNAELLVQLVDTPGIEEDQCHEGVDGALLCEPEAELVAADADRVERFRQQDAEDERDQEPDDFSL